MRIVGGVAGGRRIQSPVGKNTRPTSERVREALFSILGAPSEEAVLDLFAGSGALGIEALSRGVGSAVFVEQNPRAIAIVRKNLEHLNLVSASTVYQSDALRMLHHLGGSEHQFQWIFVDPPYNSGLDNQVLEFLGRLNLLTTDGTVIIEHDRRGFLPKTSGGLLRTDHRRYGDTCLSFYTQRITGPISKTNPP